MFVVKFVEQSLAASIPTIIIFGSLNFYPFILKAIWQLDIQWICLPGEYGWPDQEQIWCQSSSPYTEAGRDQSDSGAAGVPWWKVYPSSNPASGLGNPGPDRWRGIRSRCSTFQTKFGAKFKRRRKSDCSEVWCHTILTWIDYMKSGIQNHHR